MVGLTPNTDLLSPQPREPTIRRGVVTAIVVTATAIVVTTAVAATATAIVVTVIVVTVIVVTATATAIVVTTAVAATATAIVVTTAVAATTVVVVTAIAASIIVVVAYVGPVVVIGRVSLVNLHHLIVSEILFSRHATKNEKVHRQCRLFFYTIFLKCTGVIQRFVGIYKTLCVNGNTHSIEYNLLHRRDSLFQVDIKHGCLVI